jgi:glyoxylase I family protein
MVKGIEHVGLCAQNPEQLVEWYVSVLNCEVVHSIKERLTFFLRFPGGGMLEVYPATDRTTPVGNLYSGLRHLAIKVDDFDSDCEYLIGHGADLISEMTVKNQDMKLAFFRDPEGNLLHFVQRFGNVSW